MPLIKLNPVKPQRRQFGEVAALRVRHPGQRAGLPDRREAAASWCAYRHVTCFSSPNGVISPLLIPGITITLL